jgi:putative peptide zinc metalloprotease protein
MKNQDLQPYTVENQIINRNTHMLSKVLEKHGLTILCFVSFGIVMSLPYQFRPGGQIKLLPQKQQNIEAQMNGRIIQVKTGDNVAWIKNGTVVAVMEAPDIDNEIKKNQDSISSQKSKIEALESNLAKLLATPKKEEINIARQKVEVAKSSLIVAIRELEAGRDRSQLSSQKVARYEFLSNEGAFAMQQYEDEKRQANIDKNNVETFRGNVETKRSEINQAQAALALVLSGPYPQEIDAARSEINSAVAELLQLQQQLKYLQDQIQRTNLVMPFDGRIVTANTTSLTKKVGSYLQKGDTFAIAVDNIELLGEVLVPEFEADKLAPDKKVEIKLFAAQGESITGKVMLIQSAAVTNETTGQTNYDGQTGKDVKQIKETSGKVVKVIVKINKPQGIAKSGMTGYAKIEGETMPVIAVFTRALVRFVTVEIWSWLP